MRAGDEHVSRETWESGRTVLRWQRSGCEAAPQVLRRGWRGIAALFCRLCHNTWAADVPPGAAFAPPVFARPHSASHLEVLAAVAAVVHERHEVLVVDVEERVLDPGHVRHVRGVRRRNDVLELLARENVDRREVALRVAVFAGLRRRDVDDLARAALDHDVRALADLPGLRRVRVGGTGRARVHVEILDIKARASISRLVVRHDSIGCSSGGRP